MVYGDGTVTRIQENISIFLHFKESKDSHSDSNNFATPGTLQEGAEKYKINPRLIWSLLNGIEVCIECYQIKSNAFNQD